VSPEDRISHSVLRMTGRRRPVGKGAAAFPPPSRLQIQAMTDYVRYTPFPLQRTRARAGPGGDYAPGRRRSYKAGDFMPVVSLQPRSRSATAPGPT
jgi:hypothetical protein